MAAKDPVDGIAVLFNDQSLGGPGDPIIVQAITAVGDQTVSIGNRLIVKENSVVSVTIFHINMAPMSTHTIYFDPPRIFPAGIIVANQVIGSGAAGNALINVILA